MEYWWNKLLPDFSICLEANVIQLQLVKLNTFYRSELSVHNFSQTIDQIFGLVPASNAGSPPEVGSWKKDWMHWSLTLFIYHQRSPLLTLNRPLPALWLYGVLFLTLSALTCSSTRQLVDFGLSGCHYQGLVEKLCMHFPHLKFLRGQLGSNRMSELGVFPRSAQW